MSALVLAVCKQKGGVGKTTTTYHLARAGVRAGRRVLVVDLDPQGTLTAIAAREDVPEGSVSVADVLSARTKEPLADVLVPGAWEGLDVAPTVGENLGVVRDELVVAGAGRGQPTKLTSELVQSGTQAPRTVTLTELQRTGVLEVVKAVGKVRESDYSTEGTPVVTGAWIRGINDDSRKLDLGRFGEDLVITRPGDVLLQNTGGLAARVDTEGGRVLTSHSFHLLRLRGEAFSPDYLAEFLVSTQNRNQMQGTTIQRVRLQDMTIRTLPREQQDRLMEHLAEVRALAVSANAILAAVSTTRQQLVDAITAGTAEIT